MKEHRAMGREQVFYGIPDQEHLEEWAALGIPFEYNDFMLPQMLEDREETERRIRAYQALGRDRSRDTLHGPFLDITVHSQDPLIRRASDFRIRQACEIAGRLGVKAMILHTNFIPNFYNADYRSGWLEQNREYFSRLLEDYSGLSIYMENMFDEEPDCLLALARELEEKRFGICLDLAHAHISETDIRTWNQVCMPYIRHYHINDNLGITDDHLPVGEGNIPWKELLENLKKETGVLIEVNGLEKYRKSRSFLQKLSEQEPDDCNRGAVRP